MTDDPGLVTTTPNADGSATLVTMMEPSQPWALWKSLKKRKHAAREILGKDDSPFFVLNSDVTCTYPFEQFR
jgi:hypothetical protein